VAVALVAGREVREVGPAARVVADGVVGHPERQIVIAGSQGQARGGDVVRGSGRSVSRRLRDETLEGVLLT
jgi:hypothetical protein